MPDVQVLSDRMPPSADRIAHLPLGVDEGQMHQAWPDEQPGNALGDFFIGANAAVSGLQILTRDTKRYRSYSPSGVLVAPLSRLGGSNAKPRDPRAG